MARCVFPIWKEHQKKFVLEQQRNGKLMKLLNLADRAIGRDNIEYALASVRGETLSMDPQDLADIFREDVSDYVERLTNRNRSVIEILQELDNLDSFQNYVNYVNS